jgi:hypothetical protein
MLAGSDRPLEPGSGRPGKPLRWLLVLGLLIALGAVFYLQVEESCKSSDSALFLERKGELAVADESLLESTDGHHILQVTLEDSLGLRVLGHLKTPVGPANRTYPALLLLGGVRTGRHSIDYIPPTRGVILFSLDYPYAGKKSGLSVW